MGTSDYVAIVSLSGFLVVSGFILGRSFTSHEPAPTPVIRVGDKVKHRLLDTCGIVIGRNGVGGLINVRTSKREHTSTTWSGWHWVDGGVGEYPEGEWEKD